MSILIIGLALFLGVHLLTTLRGTRAAVIGRLGEGGYKGLYSLVAAAGLILIFIGFGSYRSAGYIQVWNPPFSLFHPIALFLLWFAFVALTATYAPPSRIKSSPAASHAGGREGLGALPSPGERRPGLDGAVRQPAWLGHLRLGLP